MFKNKYVQILFVASKNKKSVYANASAYALKKILLVFFSCILLQQIVLADKNIVVFDFTPEGC